MSNPKQPVRTLYAFSLREARLPGPAQCCVQDACVTLAIIILAILWAIASIVAAVCVELRGADPASTLARIFRRARHAPHE